MVERFICSMAVMVAFALFAEPLSAATIHSNLGPGDGFDPTSGWNVATASNVVYPADQAIAMPFTVSGTNYTFTSAELAMLYVEGPSSLEISLTADAGGVPSSEPIETIIVNLGVGPALVTANSSGNPTLISGATYWITAVAGGNHGSEWMFAGTPGGNHSIGIVGFSYDFGSSWSTSTGEEAAFRVNGAAVPEPSSLTLVGLGLLGLLGYCYGRQWAA